MKTIIRSLRRDHRDIEGLLRILERECNVFSRAERPDYELLGKIIDYLGTFLDQYHQPKEDFLFNVARARNATCARIIDDIATERTIAASSLQALSEALRDILNEQRVLRQTFDDAARSFIQHERRQIEIEEQRLFPEASSMLASANWAELHTRLRDENMSLRTHRLKERLRGQRDWIIRQDLAGQQPSDK